MTSRRRRVSSTAYSTGLAASCHTLSSRSVSVLTRK
jgi:hypothetical protein